MSNQDEILKYVEKHTCKLCGSMVDKPTQDSEYNEIHKDHDEEDPIDEGKPSREELLVMLDDMNNSFDMLPKHVQFGFVTQCDLNAALLLIAQILKKG